MKAGIIGGSGYTGRELIKILVKHSSIDTINVYGRRHGSPLSDEIIEIKGIYDEKVQPVEEKAILADNDVLFMALPHLVSMEFSPKFQNKLTLIDLSADYRLNCAKEYKKFYGKEHLDQKMLGQYIYGLPELNRDQIKNAKNIANPGCYPTSVILGLLPLLEKSLIDENIIADSKSGHSGAGKKLSESLHAGAITDNIQPYKILNHQHKGEILQNLSLIAGSDAIKLTFTPHIMPFDRGIMSTMYVNLKEDITQADVDEIYIKRYKNEPFVRVFNNGGIPNIKHSIYSNFCDIACFVDEDNKKATIISCIDNLIKGASGQAVQNMNIALGLEEKEGLYA